MSSDFTINVPLVISKLHLELTLKIMITLLKGEDPEIMNLIEINWQHKKN
jgi:hypothetical protein